MARIRTIKPEFWTDSKTGTLSDKATKLFIGLLSHCDDYGVIRFDIAEFSAKIFPFENFREHSRLLTQVLYDEILPKGLAIIFSYSDDDENAEKFLWIKNFEKHQRVDKPGKPNVKDWVSGDNPKSYAEKHCAGYAELGADFMDNSENIRENSRDVENIPAVVVIGSSKGKGIVKEKERDKDKSCRAVKKNLEDFKATLCRDGSVEPEETEKPGNKVVIPYGLIIDHLNQQTGKNFRPDGKNTQRKIKALWNRGFHIEDFFAVIDKKVVKWKCDPKMVDYLRPETLFGEKFESYLNETTSGKPAVRRFSETTEQNIVNLTAWAEDKEREEQETISAKHDIDG